LLFKYTDTDDICIASSIWEGMKLHTPKQAMPHTELQNGYTDSNKDGRVVLPYPHP
jgi:hypothetical protein